MNAKLWVCVIVGVLVAHLALLVVIHNVRNLREPKPEVKVAEPNFFTSTTTTVDPKGRKMKEVSEFTVSTEMANEATLKNLPPPPSASAQ